MMGKMNRKANLKNRSISKTDELGKQRKSITEIQAKINRKIAVGQQRENTVNTYYRLYKYKLSIK